MNIFYCKTCGNKIPHYNRADSLHCNEGCRKRAYDLINRIKSPKSQIKPIVGVGSDKNE